MALQDIYTHEGLNSAACNASADLERLGPGNIFASQAAAAAVVHADAASLKSQVALVHAAVQRSLAQP